MKTLLLAAFGGALLAAPVAAQNPAHPERVETVRYADLNLATESGRAALDRRLRAAVAAACGPASSADPQGADEIRRCRAETLAALAAERDQAVAAANRNATVLAAQ